MSQVQKSALHDFANGETVTETMLDQNFEILRTASNDTDTKVSSLAATSLTKATADATYTNKQGDHQGTWNGLTTANVVAQGVDGARLTALEEGINSPVFVTLNRGVQNVNVSMGNGTNTIPFNILNIKGRTLINLLGRGGSCGDASKFSYTYGTLPSTFSVDSSTSLYGNNSIKIIISSATSYKGIPVTLTSGNYYVALLDVKNNNGVQNVNISARRTDGSYIGGNNVWSLNYSASYVKFQSNGTEESIGAYISNGNGVSYSNIDGLRLYQITQAEYNALGTTLTDINKIAEKYPYVDDMKSLTNPFVKVYGQNLLPPVTNVNPYNVAGLFSYDISNGGYTVTLTCSSVPAGNEQVTSSEDIPITGGVPYTFVNPSTTSYLRFRVDFSDGTAAKRYVIDKGVTRTITFPINAYNLSVVYATNLTGYTDENNTATYTYATSGTFTQSNATMNIGSVAIPFAPRNDNPVYFQTSLASSVDGSVQDSLVYENGQFVKTSRFKEMVLDGTLSWAYLTDYAGFKRVNLTGIPTSLHKNLVKYDGKIISNKDTSLGSDTFDLDTTYGLIMSIADTDSGWGETYTPTAQEIQAYFYGWKMYDGTTINNTSTYTSGVKWWAYRDANGNFIGGVNVLPTTQAPVTSNYWNPYRLLYRLVTPTQEVVQTEGSFPSLVNGANQVELGESVIVRELVPNFVDNGDGTTSINTVTYPTKFKMLKPLAVYKNGKLDLSWTFGQRATSSTYIGTLGTGYAQINNSNLDKTASYSITYIAMSYTLSSSILSLDGSYESNLRKDVDRNTANIADLGEKVTALEINKANKQQGQWIAPTLLNGWVNYGTSQNAKYYKNDFGDVKIKGLIKSGTIGSIAFYLPVGYRPIDNATISVSSNGGYGQITIGTDGSVTVNIGSNVALALDNITFRAEQ